MEDLSENRDFPRQIFLFSGKRKCGKDHLSDIFQDEVGKERSVMLRIAGPIKQLFAEKYNLDVNKLLSSDAFKVPQQA